MLILEPITNRHLQEFVPIKGQEQELETLRELFYDRNEPHQFCLLNGQEPVLLLGMKEKWVRVFDTYTVFSPSWKPVYYKSVIRAAKGYFRFLEYDRIEHLTHCDRPWTDKMAKAFGFEYAATLRKYINGKDYKLYEMVNGRT